PNNLKIGDTLFLEKNIVYKYMSLRLFFVGTSEF
ncbi:unnamed protein product, partial [Brassica rapa]